MADTACVMCIHRQDMRSMQNRGILFLLWRAFGCGRANVWRDSSGKNRHTADRLIAEGKMTEMILVMQKCSKRKEARIPEEMIQKYRVIPGEEHRAMIKAQDEYLTGHPADISWQSS